MNWYALAGINPEPWTPGDITTMRKGGKVFGRMVKDGGLVAYQEAVKEGMLARYPDLNGGDLYEAGARLHVRFFLWRDLPSYKSESGRLVRKHVADATNLQKALEDALQGVLFTNDRNNTWVETIIMAQWAGTNPMILVGIDEFYAPAIPGLAQLACASAEQDAYPLVSWPANRNATDVF